MSIRHGTYQGYNIDGCRCRPCTDAWAMWMNRYTLRQLRGERFWVPSAEIAAHLAPLTRLGVTPGAIAKAAGISPTRMKAVLEGRRPRVRHDAAARLLRLSFDDLADGAWMDSTHAEELVDKIHERGIPKVHIARRAFGWVTNSWTDFNPKVTVGLYRKLLAFLADLERPRCEDCGEDSLAGGRWCLTCFHRRSTPAPRTGHGTEAGYTAHRRAGTTPCQSCRDAHAAYSRYRQESAA
jgi:hypothetical protein